jgi:hypothetical protein
MSVANIAQSQTVASIVVGDRPVNAVNGVSLTLLPSHAGSLLATTVSGTNITFTLPAASASSGFRYSGVIISTAASNTMTITSGTTNIWGSILGLSTGVVCNGKTNIIFGSTAVRGDSFELYSDGAAWYCKCFSQVTGAITVS